LCLYGATLAPTILWGDDGHLQMNAALGILQGSAGSHPLWVWIAHQFTRIPLGDMAGRVNAVSAVFGAATTGLLFMILREVGLGRGASVLATLAFLVSHTFWSHAVRAEVYTLTLALMALLAWTSLRWYHTGQRRYLASVGLVLGLGMAAHLMVLLYGLPLLWLVWRGRARLDGRGILIGALTLVIGLSPLAGLVIRDARVLGLDTLEAIRWALFTFEGYDFSHSFFDFSLRLFPSDLFQWLAFLGIQFVGLAGICGIIGFVHVWRTSRRDQAIYVLLLYGAAMAFAFAYRVGDRYVFYMPSYLAFAIWIGFGFQWVLGRPRRQDQGFRKKRWSFVLLVALVVGVPVAAYRLAPELVSRGITFRDSRHVPGPRGRYFFLWPPKPGYADPRVYAEGALAAAMPNTVLLADPALAAPVQYLQVMEGVRPDVTMRYCCWDIDVALAEAEGRPIALGDVAPEIYPMNRLHEEYEIRPRGPIYLLTSKSP
jgi:hypothetical protein